MNSIEESLANLKRTQGPDRLEKFLELAGNAWLSHERGLPQEKREPLKTIISNREVTGKITVLEPSIPFREIANRLKTDCCDQHQDIPRTVSALLDSLSKLNEVGELPDLHSSFDRDQHKSADGDDSTPLDVLMKDSNVAG